LIGCKFPCSATAGSGFIDGEHWWLTRSDSRLPGVPPTHRKAEIPFTAVVCIRGDRLYHEHISWDQGTVLRQLGLMPEYLPSPYPLPEGHSLSNSGKVEYRVPVLGIETAKKLRDRNAVPSNEMFAYTVREKGEE